MLRSSLIEELILSTPIRFSLELSSNHSAVLLKISISLYFLRLSLLRVFTETIPFVSVLCEASLEDSLLCAEDSLFSEDESCGLDSVELSDEFFLEI